MGRCAALCALSALPSNLSGSRSVKRLQSFPSWLHRRFLLGNCLLLAGAALVGSATEAARSQLMEASAWLACALVGGSAWLFRRTLHPLFGLLLTLAAIVNTAGYVFGLWHEQTPFDEIVHAFTAFAGMAAAGGMVLKPHLQPRSGLFWRAAAIALVIGLAWEAFEWAVGIIGDLRDTSIDLLMDVVGAVAAAALLLWLAHRLPDGEQSADGAEPPSASQDGAELDSFS